MQLSEHFTYDEAIASQTAARLGIDNHPSSEILSNMVSASNQLEKIRNYLEKPISVSSWYRSEAVNVAVGGVAKSAHTSGWAIDFNCYNFGTLKEVVKAVTEAGVQFDQVIWEFDSWCHISFDPKMRNQILTIRKGTGYMIGLVG